MYTCICRSPVGPIIICHSPTSAALIKLLGAWANWTYMGPVPHCFSKLFISAALSVWALFMWEWERGDVMHRYKTQRVKKHSKYIVKKTYIRTIGICQRSRWLRRHPVGVVLNYADLAVLWIRIRIGSVGASCIRIRIQNTDPDPQMQIYRTVG